MDPTATLARIREIMREYDGAETAIQCANLGDELVELIAAVIEEYEHAIHEPDPRGVQS